MKARPRMLVLGILLAAGAVGCGQQGPLVLPESARPIERADSPAGQPERSDDEQQDER